MKPEDLINLLTEQGLQEQEIAELLKDACQLIGGCGEQEQPEEDDDKKMQEVFGI